MSKLSWKEVWKKNKKELIPFGVFFALIETLVIFAVFGLTEFTAMIHPWGKTVCSVVGVLYIIVVIERLRDLKKGVAYRE